MPEKISIMKESGELLNSNIVSIFMIPETQKKYVITTENAVDPHGLTVLHVSELINNDEDLAKIATDEEWSTIKTIMRAIISGNVGSYQYLPLMEKARGKGQYSRDISVSASACKQMIDNYTTSLKSLSEVKKDAPAVEVENNSENGIFPADNVVTNEVNEVSPGIADVTKVDIAPVSQEEPAQAIVTPQPVEAVPLAANGTADVAPSILQGVPDEATASQEPVPVQNAEVVPVQDNAESVTTPEVPVIPVAPVETEVTPVVEESTPVVEVPAPVVEEPAVVAEPSVEPVSGISTENNLAADVPVSVEVQQISVPEVTSEVVSPVAVETPVIAVAEPATSDENDVQTENQVNIDKTSLEAITNSFFDKLKEVQNNSIKQEEPVVQTNINTNVAPSFAPDATLDQVVVGAQDLFMNGVQSLVQTITEKVYRDLYRREMELNEREELLNQREKMLNEQISMMVNNFSTNHSTQEAPVDNSGT